MRGSSREEGMQGGKGSEFKPVNGIARDQNMREVRPVI